MYLLLKINPTQNPLSPLPHHPVQPRTMLVHRRTHQLQFPEIIPRKLVIDRLSARMRIRRRRTTHRNIAPFAKIRKNLEQTLVNLVQTGTLPRIPVQDHLLHLQAGQ